MDCVSVGRMGQIITKVTDDFYRITEVFPDEVLHKVQSAFCYVGDWKREPNIQGVRLASSTIDGNLTVEIQDSLGDIKKFIESHINKKTHWNGPVLWHDESGYINACHKDQSENLSINIQVYMTEGDEVQGTFYENNGEWFSVPYQLNTGYIMFNPTQHEHGMKHPSTAYRQSLYISLRTTEELLPFKNSHYWEENKN